MNSVLLRSIRCVDGRPNVASISYVRLPKNLTNLGFRAKVEKDGGDLQILLEWNEKGETETRQFVVIANQEILPSIAGSQFQFLMGLTIPSLQSESIHIGLFEVIL